MAVSVEEWRLAVARAGKAAHLFLALSDRERMKPGDAVLGMMIAAYGLTHTVGQLPSFEWYATKTVEILTGPSLAERERNVD